MGQVPNGSKRDIQASPVRGFPLLCLLAALSRESLPRVPQSRHAAIMTRRSYDSWTPLATQRSILADASRMLRGVNRSLK